MGLGTARFGNLTIHLLLSYGKLELHLTKTFPFFPLA